MPGATLRRATPGDGSAASAESAVDPNRHRSGRLPVSTEWDATSLFAAPGRDHHLDVRIGSQPAPGTVNATTTCGGSIQWMVGPDHAARIMLVPDPAQPRQIRGGMESR